MYKVLFVNKKKLEEKTDRPENLSNCQIVFNIVNDNRDTLLVKEKFYAVSCGPKYAILTNSI